MQNLGIVICAIFLCGASVEAVFFKIENCSKDNHSIIAYVSNFDVSPDPVVLKKGNMNISMDLRIRENVPDDAVIKTRFYKLTSIFGINIDVRIPCILGKFGSCSINHCKYLNLFKEQFEPLFPEGTEYGCPLNAGKYGGDNVHVKIPDLGIFARLLVSGRYRIEFEVVSKGNVLFCYKVFAEMK